MTTDPTTPRPTDAAIALVREAVQMLEGDWTVGGIDITTEHAMALLAHPTLARVIAIGQAWVAAERALPEDYAMGEVWQRRDRTWEATARCFVKDKPYRMVPATGPTPEAALLALAAALTDQERSHD